MGEPIDKKLYEKVKKMADNVYDRHSAYKSGWIQKKYKELGGKYKKTNEEKKLTRWFNENWQDINKILYDDNKKRYPLYRPTKRITEDTPKTYKEISEKRLKEQSKLKQKYKSKKNLPKF